MVARPKVPNAREIHIHASAGHTPDFIFWCMNRKQPYGASAARKGDIVSVEKKVDGKWYIYYYEILSDGHTGYTREGHTYMVRKIDNKEQAENLAKKWQKENREMVTVCLSVRESKTWNLYVRVPKPSVGEKDAERVAVDQFYDMGGHGFLDEIATVNSCFEVEDSWISDSKAEMQFDEDGDLVYIKERNND